MEYRRIAGAAVAAVTAVVALLLPELVHDFPMLAKELIWEAVAIVFAIGLGFVFWPVRRKKHAA